MIKLSSLIVLFYSVAAFASESLSYSGRLVNTDGSPVTGPVNLRFELAYSNSPGVILCNKEITGVVLSNGVFHSKLDFAPTDCMTPTATPLSSILLGADPGETPVIRVIDQSNTKTYSFQAFHSMPFAMIADMAKTLSPLAPADTGKVLQWNGTTWVPATLGAGTGSVNNVSTGTGLTGGPITTTGTISIANGGVGTTQLADGAVTDIKLASGIARAKIASGAASQVVVNDGTGALSSVATIPLTQGGTGAANAADARTNLGLGAAAVLGVGYTGTNLMPGAGVPTCLSGAKLHFTGAGPTWWSCIPEDGNDNSKLPLGGGTMVGAIEMSGFKVTGLPTPTDGDDAANKDYVDNQISAESLWDEAGGSVFRSTGNVGVGTATPTALLDVNGAAYIGSSTASGTILRMNSERPWTFESIGSGAATSLSLRPTSDSKNFAITSTDASKTMLGIIAKNDGTGTVMLNAQGGNVGVGTATPTSLVDIQKTSSATSLAAGMPSVRVINTNATQGDGSTTSNASQFKAEAGNGAVSVQLMAFYDTGAYGSSAVLKSGTNHPIIFAPNSVERVRMATNGNVGIGTSTPTAALHLKAGTATAGTAPLKLTSGANLTTPEAGAVEYDGTNLYFTDNSNTRKALATSVGASSFQPAAGNAGAPSYSFSTDTNTGFFSSGADQIGIAANGAQIFNIGSTGIVSSTAGGSAISTAAGTAAAPTYSYSGDADTGWYAPLANTLAAATDGAERIRIDSSGRVGINTNNPTAMLDVNKGNILFSGDLLNLQQAYSNTSYDYARLTMGVGGQVHARFEAGASAGNNNPGFLSIYTNDGTATPVKRMTIDHLGNTGIGTATPLSKLDVNGALAVGTFAGTATVPANSLAVSGNIYRGQAGSQPGIYNSYTGLYNYGPSLQVSGQSADTSSAFFANFQANTAGPNLILAHSRNAVNGGHTILQTNDEVGVIHFQANGGTEFLSTGKITSRVVVTPAVGDIVSELHFSTRAAGGTGPTQRMIIDSTGRMGVGTPSPTAKVTIAAGSAVAGTAPLKFTSGTVMTTPEAGAVEYDGTNLFFTDSTNTRRALSASGSSSVQPAAGTAAAPSHSFSTDTDTGLYSGGANTIGIAAGGAQIFALSSSGMVSSTAGGSAISSAAGTAAAPTYAFSGDADTGWYAPAANALAAATAGVERIRIDSSGNVGIGTTAPSTTTGKTLQINNDLNDGTANSNTTLNLISTNRNSQIGLSSADTGTSQILMSNPSLSNAAGLTYNHGTQLLLLRAGGVNRLAIDGTNGNTGIGTTSPSTTLHLAAGGNVANAGGEIGFSARSGYSPIASIKAHLAFSTGSEDQGDLALYTRPQGAAGQVLTERMRILSGGNVGIGTSSPTSKLTIHGTTSSLLLGTPGTAGTDQISLNIATVTDGTLGLNNAATKGWQIYGRGNAYTTAGEQNDLGIAFWNGTTWKTSQVIDSVTGNIGMGVGTPTSILHLKAGTATAGTAPLKLSLGVNLTTPEAGAIEYDGTNVYYTDNSGARRTLTSASGSGAMTNITSISNAAGNIALTPNSLTGSVSVGPGAASTNSTSGALVVTGDTGISGLLNVGGSIKTNNTFISPLGTAAAPSYAFTGDADTGMFSPAADMVALSTAGTERFRINSTGQVGIGTGATGLSALLHIHQATGTAADFVRFRDTADTVDMAIRYNGTNGYEVRSEGAGGGSVLLGLLSTNGNVGVGTGTPAAKFEVNSNSTSISNLATSPDEVMRLSWNDNTTDIGSGAGIKLTFFGPSANNVTSNTEIGNIGISKENNLDGNLVNSMLFSTHDGTTLSERMRITGAGNVGIGTTTPTSILTVQQDGLTSSYVSAANGSSGSMPWTGTTSPVLLIRNSASTSSGASYLAFAQTEGTTSKANISYIASVTKDSDYSPSLVFGGRSSNTGYMERMRIDTSNGNVGIGTTTPIAPLQINRAYSTNTASEEYGLVVTTNFSETAGSGQKSSVRSNTSISHTSGTLPIIWGHQSLMSASGSGGTTTDAGGLWSRVDVASGAIVTNAFGLMIENGIGTGNPVNNYGIFMKAMSQGSSKNFSIYAEGTSPSYFGGNIGIGTNNPGSGLHVQKGASAGIGLQIQGGASSTADHMRWLSSAGATQGVIDSTGQIGIGTSAPQGALHLLSAAVNPLIIERATGANAAAMFKNTTGTAYSGVNTNGHYAIGYNVNLSVTPAIVALPTNFVGINITTPTDQLHVAGNIRTTGCLYYASSSLGTCSSDKRLKKDIKKYDLGLDALMGINPVTFKYNGLGERTNDGITQLGVIAQDVEKTAPQLVKTQSVKMHKNDKTKTMIKAVDYGAFTFVLINSVKDLYTKWVHDSEEKDKKIKELELRIQRLEAKLESR